MKRRSDWLTATGLIAVAVYFVLVTIRPSRSDGMPAFDIYSYYFPNMMYALRSVRDGGRGFFWNALNNCGQPFLGISSTGSLYPANLLFLVLSGDQALKGVILLNFVAAGVCAYLLCKELGVGTTAALSGALAFELGNSTVGLSMWGPQISGTWVWLPAALLFCERILKAPAMGSAIALGVMLTLPLLPGFPQAVFFAYQLIALRVLWEFATRRVSRPGAVVLFIGVGLLLPVLLAAVELVPGIEMARLSVRNAALSVKELAPAGFLSWERYRGAVAQRRSEFNPLILLPALLATVALFETKRRRYALFYLVGGLLYFTLAFGENTPLFTLYEKLPLGTLFRDPLRFMWLPSFCLAVLTGLGVEAFLSPHESHDESWQRYAQMLVPLPVLLGFYFLSPTGLSPVEWTLVGVALACGIVARFVPRRRPLAALILTGAVLTNLLIVHSTTFVRLIPTANLLYSHAPVLIALRNRMTPQDRAYPVTRHLNFTLEQKTPSLFGVPSVHDYEPQPTGRYAEFFTLMRIGREPEGLNEFYYPMEGYAPPGLKRRLLNLAAAHYLVVGPAVDTMAATMTPPLRRLPSPGALHVYENTEALPRAFYVSRIEVVPDPRALLRRLADGTDDPREVALVEEELPSGFRGGLGNHAPASVDFVKNDPEDVVIHVQAPQQGFLFLSDQHFPGWQATVNGAKTPIVRANYLFRLVEVPAGESLVEFHYAPLSVRIGAAVSALTLAGLGVFFLISYLKRAL